VRLYVDDVRPVPAGWRLARTIEQAIHILKSEPVEEVSLDYVIGVYEETNFAPVARFIAQLPRERRPRRVTIHTSSTHGARELMWILEGFVDEIRRA
jgi:hypothetical protein